MLRVTDSPWIKHDQIQGSLLYPGAGMAAMALEAARQLSHSGRKIEGYEIRDMIMGITLVVPRHDHGIQTMMVLRVAKSASTVEASSSPWLEFRLYSRLDVWTLNASGHVRVRYTIPGPGEGSFVDENNFLQDHYTRRREELSKLCYRTLNPPNFYDELSSVGVQFGPTFRNLFNVRIGKRVSLCHVRIPETKSIMPCGFHGGTQAPLRQEGKRQGHS